MTLLNLAFKRLEPCSAGGVSKKVERSRAVIRCVSAWA